MAETFERRVHLPVNVEEAFDWHERPGALDRLIPPWERVTVDQRGDGIRDGSVIELAQQLGAIKLNWIAKHYDFRPNGDGNGVLTDHIEYRVPGGVVGRLLGGPFVKRKVATMFTYRHNKTRDDLAAHAKHKEKRVMNVAIAGASGLVGSTLVPMLTTGGHRVTKLVRRPASDCSVTWDPQSESFDGSSLDGVDTVVHLAGENIAAARWTAKVKDKIRDSRVQGTRVLCEGLAQMRTPPRVLVCASAIGFYGDRDDEVLTEDSAAGSSFLADVAQEWEAATQPARDAGIRVVNLRFGVILSPKDGALAKMLLPFKLGAGGRVGSGRQYWSWISIDDAAGAIHHALMTDSLSGPVNAVAPNPVTNAEFTKTLGRVLVRPAILPMPAFAARLALGEMADELLLASIRVEPRQLIESGYDFRQPTLESAIRHLLGKPAYPRSDHE
jgi:hypothetical protein